MHLGFGVAVEGACGLIEDQDLRLAQDGPGQGEALPLASAEAVAVLPDQGVVAGGQGADEVVGAGRLGGLLDRLKRNGVAHAERDVGGNGVVEQEHLLADYTQVPLPAVQIQSLQIDPINENLSCRWVEEAYEQIGDGGFTSTGGSHQGQGGTPGEREVQIA